MQTNQSLLAYAYGVPLVQGVYKVLPEDFRVEEQIGYPLSGDGEHLWCWVEKTGENTDWVLQQLAKWANVPSSRVGVAGQKDRHAVTRQWFSIQLPGLVNPDFAAFNVPNVRILKWLRHGRKLQTGGLSGNKFTLVVRDVQNHVQDDTQDDVQGSAQSNVVKVQNLLDTRLACIAQHGVPNYFGEQRFGHFGHNLKQAQRLFAGELTRVKPNQKSLYLSAVRSQLFNLMLSERVADGSWNQLLAGDVLQLEGSNKWFLEDGSANLAQRMLDLDVHPTGLLASDGVSQAEHSVKVLEERVCAQYPDWIKGLTQLGLKSDRRALRVKPLDFSWHWLPTPDKNLMLQVSFTLRPGSYATMVLREIMHTLDAQAPTHAANA
ncbi:tRNA pseudouridine(13) synthase TruD [Thiomicrorhabdus aquaedulcis]|uniref:tRNA pseudouridine(13) synthase TruD n=1 Tax=Thiomicrorhabdus aquaedulcis TaxID=2211106 RepID=UPI000FDB3D69|nr:tRNA pseudouridine(13) synthase TruD [Thiomicrorhabdus aquaedulcis]